MSELAVKAFWFGIISAVSLPLGAIIGLALKPKSKVISAVMSFGAGALLAALTFELVFEALEKAGFYPLALGAIIGGITFALLNQLLEQKGAFLRKAATAVRFLTKVKRENIKEIFTNLSRVQILLALPPEEIQAIIPLIKDVDLAKGSTIFNQGEVGDGLYLIKSGEVEIKIKAQGTDRGEEEIAVLKDKDAFGEMALLTSEERNATAIARTDVKLWKISKEDFDALLKSSPLLVKAVNTLLEERIKDLRQKEIIAREEGKRWVKKAIYNLDEKTLTPTASEIKEVARSAKHKNAAFAIWLGIFLDGIPESIVIGASMLHAAVSIPLIVGLFLANLPESMSSAVVMRNQGSSINRIMWMWTPLTILTGIGAYLGNIFFVGVSPAVFAIFEGMAAGAMLCMIAETMLPEAYEQGGAIVGISTLLGFLAAIFCKSLGH